MAINKETLDLIKQFEGLVLKAYVDPGTGNEPITICYGTTVYPDGKKVKMGDVRTQTECEQYLLHDVTKFSENVKKLLTRTLSDNQFGALVSLAYNVGVGNLKTSTLLRKVNVNPNDLSIAQEFMRWNTANHKVMAGLTRRRTAEKNLYFS